MRRSALLLSLLSFFITATVAGKLSSANASEKEGTVDTLSSSTSTSSAAPWIAPPVESEAASARFKDTFSFLEHHPSSLSSPSSSSSSSDRRKFEVRFVQFPDGNYTGEVDAWGRRHGWGEILWRNGTLYGKDNIFVYFDGDRYVGQWKNHTQNGIGTFFSQTGVYVGSWLDGLQSGNGTALFHNGNKYVGQFKDGFKEGYGVFTASTEGDEYAGHFKKGVRSGHGIEVFANGERYVGEYADDLRHGRGTAYYPNGAVKYLGEWMAGSPHGNGTFVAPSGIKYVGDFYLGQMTGHGVVYNADGTLRGYGVGLVAGGSGGETNAIDKADVGVPPSKSAGIMQSVGNFFWRMWPFGA